MAKRLLVTGGAGFIGSNFIRMVLRDHSDYEVINLDKLTYAGNLHSLNDIAEDPRYRFVKGDICDQGLMDELLSDEHVSGVIHFAAESHVDRSIEGPEAFITANILGTQVLLEAAKRHALNRDGFRFVHVSTDEVYGSLGATGIFTETSPYLPNSPYSASKASSDHFARAYFETYGLPVLITHCSNNYGPYQFPEKLIPLIFHNAMNGKELPVYGDGKNVRDWIHVEDHCRGVMRVFESGVLGEVYNIGADAERENIQIVEAICDILDHKLGELEGLGSRRELIRYVKDRPGHDLRYAIDSGKIHTNLGWTPSISFEAGLEQTLEWYLQNGDWLATVMDGSYREYYAGMYTGR